MPSKSKIKGSYHERWFLKWLTELGFSVKKQPLSGSLGGEYSGDLVVDILDEKLITEIKYRDASSFPNAFSVLEGRDIAFFKRKVGKPKTCLIIDGDVFERLWKKLGKHLANDLLESHQKYLRKHYKELLGEIDEKNKLPFELGEIDGKIK